MQCSVKRGKFPPLLQLSVCIWSVVLNTAAVARIVSYLSLCQLLCVPFVGSRQLRKFLPHLVSMYCVLLRVESEVVEVPCVGAIYLIGYREQ